MLQNTLKNSFQNLRIALQPMNVDDFISRPAEYITLFTAISLPTTIKKPDHSNLPKPLYAVTYGECQKIQRTLDDAEALLNAETLKPDALKLFLGQLVKVKSQLSEIISYAGYITAHPKYDDSSDAYHLTTFINNFTNSRPGMKSPYPAYSGTSRHKMTVGGLRNMLMALRDIDKALETHGNFAPHITEMEMEAVC